MGEIFFSFLNNLILVVLLNIFGFGVIFWVYFSNRREKVNQFFLLMMTPIILWTDFNYISNTTNISHISIIFKRLNLAAVCVFFIFVYFFSLHFPRPPLKRYLPLDKIVIFSWSLIFILTIFTGVIIKDVEIKNGFPDFIFGIGSYLFYPLVAFFTFFILFILFQKYFTLTKKDKLKVQYFLIGAFIFAFFNLIFNVIFPLFRGIEKYYQLGDYSVFFLLGFTAYAIVKQELFGVKVVLTELLVAAMGVILLVLPFLMPSSGLRILTGAVLALFLIFSYLLTKYTYAQEKRRERAEEIADKERELRKKAEKVTQDLKHLNDIRNQMFLTGQHHTRTPLSNIKNFASVLLGGGFGPINKEQKRALEVIMAKVEESIELANLYLSVSQLEAGRGYLKKEKTDIVQLIKEQIEKLKLDAQTKGVKIITNLEKDLPEIKIDKTQLGPCIYAIIDNAIKYCPRKVGRIEVSLKRADQHTLLFSCKDNGIGIKKEDLGYIGKYAYQRTDEARRAHGTGKGLALYYTNLVVQEHKGRFWVESEGPDKGAVFYIELPIK